MKTSKILLTGLCLVFAVSVTRAQSPKYFRDSLIARAVKQLIDSRQFIFFVQSVMAPGGTSVPMAGENYTFRIKTDSVQLNLPYVGAAIPRLRTIARWASILKRAISITW